MRLIVISYQDNFKEEHNLLLRLFEEGLEYFHLRKPDKSLDEVAKYISEIPQEHHNKIVLHSHFSLLDSFNLKGIHFNSAIREDNNIKVKKNILRSTSCHSFDELLTLGSDYEYAFLSPIFDSISKEGYKSKFDEEAIKNFFNENNPTADVIALGGINEENALKAVQIGFDGIALLGNIWKLYLLDQNMEQAVTRFKTIKKQLS